MYTYVPLRAEIHTGTLGMRGGPSTLARHCRQGNWSANRHEAWVSSSSKAIGGYGVCGDCTMPDSCALSVEWPRPSIPVLELGLLITWDNQQQQRLQQHHVQFMIAPAACPWVWYGKCRHLLRSAWARHGLHVSAASSLQSLFSLDRIVHNPR